jgi:hypothetical protein
MQRKGETGCSRWKRTKGLNTVWGGGSFAHMDDTCVSTPDRQTYLAHFEAFFAVLAANGLATNLEKCVFAVPTLKLLGLMIFLTAGLTPTA